MSRLATIYDNVCLNCGLESRSFTNNTFCNYPCELQYERKEEKDNQRKMLLEKLDLIIVKLNMMELKLESMGSDIELLKNNST